MSFINILGVNVNTFGKNQILAEISEFFNNGRQNFIVTPNPEIILAANIGDNDFFKILNSADLSLPDGTGLKIAAWFLGVNLSRIVGADLLKDILDMAESQNRRVAVLNWMGGLSSAKDIGAVLRAIYPNLEVLAIDSDRQAIISDNVLPQIQIFKPEIIFSTFGAPYQEKFIYCNMPKLPSVKLGMGVGGAFDFLTGKLPRAPKIMRSFGIEWLWRFYKQPSRWRRIYKAVIVFPVKFLIYYYKFNK